MIAIVDYGMGNLSSVQKGLARAGYASVIAREPEEVEQASGMILPGVGAFEDAMKNLAQGGFSEVIPRMVRQGKPLLGICLGMQLLFEESEENGVHRGLGILPGRVVRFRLPEDFKVPHMGWNKIKKTGDGFLFHNIPEDSYFYFVHSYYAVPQDQFLVEAVTNYGLDFPAAVGRGRVFGVQFHPEKSSDLGLLVLKNFGELVRQ